MTEAEWQTSGDPTAMFAFIRPTASERKLRYFGCACCRRAFDDMDHAESRALVELTEAYLEGAVTSAELVAAGRRHEQFCHDAIPDWEYVNAADQATRDGTWPYPHMLEYIAPSAVRGRVRNLLLPIREECERKVRALPSPFDHGVPVPSEAMFEHHRRCVEIEAPIQQAEIDYTVQERLVQSDYLRDIFGNQFRPVAFDPTWRTEAVVALARGIYADRAFDRLPVLADALDDAGCTDADVLAHCRGTGPHVRGCWVVDGLLGKS